MKSIQTLVLAMSAAALSACSLAPDYQQPELTVLPKHQTAIAVAPLNWQRFYQDEQLKQLIALALKNNKSLQINDLQLQQLQANYQIESSQYWPDINLSASGTRQRNSQSSTTSAFMPKYSSSYSASVGFTAYELDFFDRIGSLKQNALAQFRAGQFAQQTLEQSLAAQVAGLYFDYQAGLLKTELQKQAVESAKQKFNIAQKQYDQGVIDNVDYRQAQSNQQLSAILLSQLEQTNVSNLNQLKQLVGYKETNHLGELSANFSLEQLQALPAKLPASALLDRPDIAQAEQNIRAANANLGVARAAFFPSISLTSSIGYASQDLSDLFKSDSHTWSFSPQINLPIFNKGRLDAQQTIAELQQKAEIIQYQDTVETAFTELNNRLTAQQSLAEQVELQKQVVANYQHQVELSELRLEQGLEDPLNYEEFKLLLVSQKQNLADLQLAFLKNQVGLFKTFGGKYDQLDNQLAFAFQD
ncbi:efflux transporter outer membrane subunit [Catenovulum sp. 2E275]|uniref:efflux transporter outer membrane subunit n=1 Tax=Catenovulum sp. 2E275 TaxID=2980497 RepID=UPI0021CDF9F6|nr:efflux transporter outer membrane subunit [Catenovulum sp. 2E275]MCU4676633.1 efflux transporter outer membrane subunit [Catenovulum sp. 2E275]